MIYSDSSLEIFRKIKFIEEKIVGNETSFAITSKGVKFLGDINKLRKISDAFGVPL
jgi:predicted transcriptional regulator